jgi:hypothetical protein
MEGGTTFGEKQRMGGNKCKKRGWGEVRRDVGVREGTPTKGRGPHHLKQEMPCLSPQGGRNFPLGRHLLKGVRG